MTRFVVFHIYPHVLKLNEATFAKTFNSIRCPQNHYKEEARLACHCISTLSSEFTAQDILALLDVHVVW